MDRKTTKANEKLEIFSERLFNARTEKKMSQSELAEKADVSTTTISEYETGKKQPKISTAKKLAVELDVSLDWLCGIGEGSVYERNPILAWYEAIKALEMKIERVTDTEVVLSYKEHMDFSKGIEISKTEIREFFEEYATAQAVTEAYKGKPGGDIILNEVKNQLFVRFKKLPKLPPYPNGKRPKARVSKHAKKEESGQAPKNSVDS